MLTKFRLPQEKRNSSDPNRQYIKPHFALQPYIAHYTLYYPPEMETGMLTIIPDVSGCIVCTVTQTGSANRFLGPTTHSVQVPDGFTPPRFFVEFLPGGARRILGIPQDGLQNAAFDLSLFDAQADDMLKTAFEASADLESFTERINSFFLSRLVHLPQEHTILRTLFYLGQASGDKMTMRDLAQYTGYSERQLGRIVKSHLGVAVKPYLRVQRINRILSRLREKDASLTALAHEYGYYDQAHFNHEFRSVCGTSPTKFLRNMTEFYNEPFKF